VSTSPSWGIVGGSGFIGSLLVESLSASGDAVASVTAPRLTAPPDTGLDTLRALLDAPAAVEAAERLTQALAGADLVVNAAGLALPDAAPSDALTGADALLPAVVARAAAAAGASRFVHISSAVVQGRRDPLDESWEVEPGTPYGRAKADGELLLHADGADVPTTVLRATSIQTAGRTSTAGARRLATSRLAAVAGAGDRPTPVCRPGSLAAAVRATATSTSPPEIVLQPWDGATTGEAAAAFGGREPRHLPVALCRVLLWTGYRAVALRSGRGFAAVRRLEVMWMGQAQVEGWLTETGAVPRSVSLRPDAPSL
jgi:dTDP-4-dehydrorhamnose reductase